MDKGNITKTNTQQSIYNDVQDNQSSKQMSPSKVAKLRPGTNSQGSGAQLFDHMNASSEHKIGPELNSADAYQGYTAGGQPMSLMVSTHVSGFGGRPDTDGWCNNSSVFVQKGIPATTLARASKSREQSTHHTRAQSHGQASTFTVGTSFSKQGQDQATAFRIRQGFASTMESRKNYLKNKDQLERTNECFIAPGSKPSAHMKLSTTDHIPSRVGKP